VLVTSHIEVLKHKLRIMNIEHRNALFAFTHVLYMMSMLLGTHAAFHEMGPIEVI
jgi:hypothetical protein